MGYPTERHVDAADWPLLIMLLLLDKDEQYHNAIAWRSHMARRTFTIEAKVDLDDNDPRYEACRLLVAKATFELMSSLTLLCSDKKAPEAVMFTEDAFFNTQEIKYAPEELEKALARLAEGELPGASVTTEGNEDASDGLDV